MTDVLKYQPATVEFPDFPADALPAIPDGWLDVSWHNDTSPSYQREDGKWRVWINYPDEDMREVGGKRFTLTEMDDGFSKMPAVIDTDDWVLITAAIKMLA